MLTSRGAGTSNENSPSAFPQRAPEQLSSSSYSFNQQFDPAGWDNPPRPPPAPSTTIVSASSASSAPATANTSGTRNETHFPKLPGPASLPSRAYSSSPAFPSLNSSSTTIPASSKWASRARKAATAAEVVASRPPENGGPSPEEEAAEKERSELETLAKLVPVGSAIPRKPIRTLGRGGLRATGSVAAMQQQRNASSKSKVTPNGASASSGSLFSIDSSTRMRSLSGGVRPLRGRKLHVGTSSRAAALLDHDGVVDSIASATSPSAVNTSDFHTDRSQQKSEKSPTNAAIDIPALAPRSSSGMSLTPSKLVSIAGARNEGSSGLNDALRVSGKHSSVRNSTPNPRLSRGYLDADSGSSGIRADTSVSTKPEANGFSSHKCALKSTLTLFRASSSNVQKGTMREISTGLNQRSTQDVRIAREPTVSTDPSQNDTSVSELDVFEQRRKAFAPSPESKSSRIRNSAYQSARKPHHNNLRRNPTSQPSALPQVVQGADLSNTQGIAGVRTDFSGQTEQRSGTFSRGKISHSKQVAGTSEYPHVKSTGGDDRLVVPTNTRAEALRSAFSANYKKNPGKVVDTRKNSSDGKEFSVETQELGKNVVIESPDHFRSCATNPRQDGHNHGKPDKVAETLLSLRLEQERKFAATKERHELDSGMVKNPGCSLEFSDPWGQNAVDFGHPPLTSPMNPGNAASSSMPGPSSSGPSSSATSGYRPESIAIGQGGNGPNSSQDHGLGLFAKSPILGVGYEGPEAWMTMTDGHDPEAISMSFLASEARQAVLRGQAKIPESPGIDAQDVHLRGNGHIKPWTTASSSSSAIETMMRIQSSARPASAPYRSNSSNHHGYPLSPSTLYNNAFDAHQSGTWAPPVSNEWQLRSSARNDPCDDVLPPLPEAGDENYDAFLKQMGVDE